MQIRSTEREHSFTKSLFKSLQLFSLQGLTLSANHEFSAAIEAIQLNDNEYFVIQNMYKFMKKKIKILKPFSCQLIALNTYIYALNNLCSAVEI